MPEPTVDDSQRAMYEWARFGLTGDTASKSPTDTQLRVITMDTILAFNESYPVTSSLNSSADISAFAKAVGFAVAALYVGTPAGAKFAGNVVQTKVGPVSRTRKEISPEVAAAALSAESDKALRRISAIRAVQVSTPLFDVVSRRETDMRFRRF